MSRLHVVTSISSGNSEWRNVSCVPQSGQKLRVPHVLEAKLLGVPWVNRNSCLFIEKHATSGAAAALRQSSQ